MKELPNNRPRAMIGLITGPRHVQRQVIHVAGLSAQQVDAVRQELTKYFGWDRIYTRY